MHAKLRVMLFMGILALSPGFFTRAIYSEGVAANSGVAFALARLEKSMSVEFRNDKGEVLLCGRLVQYQLRKDMLEAVTTSDREHMPDCRVDFAGKKHLRTVEIAFVEVVAPAAEFYAFDEGRWQLLSWRKPVKRSTAPFAERSGVPTEWRRYSRPPKAIPGVFWPDLRVSGGGYALSRLNDVGVPMSMALDFKVHPRLYALSASLDATLGFRLRNGDSELLSPKNFLLFRFSALYSVLQKQKWSVAALLGGGLMSYQVDGDGTANGVAGVRGVIGAGAIIYLHAFKNNRDFHKVSFFFNPMANWIMNRDEGNPIRWPWLVEMKLGALYAY